MTNKDKASARLSAWGDESQSNASRDPGTYILAVAALFDADLDAARDAMSQFRLNAKRKLHWRSDSPSRHRKVVLSGGRYT